MNIPQITYDTLFRGRRKKAFLSSALFFLFLLLPGCSFFMSSASVDLANNLTNAVVNNNDLATVEAGAPAYLLLVDSLLEDDPDNESLLQIAADLYNVYTCVFVKDADRARRLTDKSVKYAFRAICEQEAKACDLRKMDFQAFEKLIGSMKKDDVPTLYTLGAAWAGWIQAHRDDMNAVAELSRVETILKKTVELDESWKNGEAHVYLGILATFLPPALGGKPEIGRKHFERAIELSDGKNLMVKVLFAKHYARLLFDRELHDKLLTEVVETDAEVKGYVLSNTLARQQARELLKSAEDYF